MNQAVTVLGPVAGEALGICQPHEHIYLHKGKSYEINRDLCIDQEALSLQELKQYRACGGGAIGDAQPVGCGRQAAVLARLSRESGVHIVASTGFHKMQFYPEDHWIFHWSAEQLQDLFCRELTTGMFALCDDHPPREQTVHRAGQIKCALDSGPLNRQYTKLFEAAAQAARQTQCPVMVHIEAGSQPLLLARFLLDQGLSPHRLAFCHMDRAVPDFTQHRQVLEMGILLEYDTIAREKYLSRAQEIQLIQKVLDLGYEDQLMLSLDTTRARLQSYGGQPGLGYILTQFVPALQQAGIDRKQIAKMQIHNPARYYAG